MRIRFERAYYESLGRTAVQCELEAFGVNVAHYAYTDYRILTLKLYPIALAKTLGNLVWRLWHDYRKG